MSKLKAIGVIGIPYNVGCKGEGIDGGPSALRKAVHMSVPNGVTLSECSRALGAVGSTGKLCGLATMVFNARKDPEGTEAEKLNRIIVDGLRQEIR